MARNFQTADPTFQDFVYQPNQQLQLQLADRKMKTQVMQSKLLDDIDDIDFSWLDASDRDNALAKKKYYKEEAENIARNFHDNPNEYQKSMGAAKRLSRELLEDYTTGDIRSMQNTVSEYERFEGLLNENLENDFQKQAYRNKHFTPWLESYKEGETDKGFSWDGSIVAPRDIMEGFLSSKRYGELSAQDRTIFDKTLNSIRNSLDSGIAYEKVDTSILTEGKIGRAFQAYLNSQEDLGDYTRTMQDVFGQKWYNEDGSLDKTSQDSMLLGYLGELKDYAIDDEKRTRTIRNNPWGISADKMLDMQKNMIGVRRFDQDFSISVPELQTQRAEVLWDILSKSGQNTSLLFGGPYNAEEITFLSSQAEDLKYIDTNTARGRDQLEALEKKILENRERFPGIANKLDELNKGISAGIDASWGIANEVLNGTPEFQRMLKNAGIDTGVAEADIDQLNKIIVDNLSGDMFFEFEDFRYGDVGGPDQIMKLEKMDMIDGRLIDKDSKITFNTKSVQPIIFNGVKDPLHTARIAVKVKIPVVIGEYKHNSYSDAYNKDGYVERDMFIPMSEFLRRDVDNASKSYNSRYQRIKREGGTNNALEQHKIESTY